MEYVRNVSPRMAFVLLNLLWLVQLPTIFASGLLQSNDCGTYTVSFSSNSGHELFYINGKLVDKGLFCKALKLDNSNRCFIIKNLGNHYCGLNLALDELHLEAGRKLLPKVVREVTTEHQNSQLSEAKNDHKSVLTPKKLAMAVPGIFVLCCAFLCPCFHARRKETAHTVLAKDPVSSSESKKIVV